MTDGDEKKRLINGIEPSDTNHAEVSSRRNTQAYVEKSKYGIFDPDEACEDI